MNTWRKHIFPTAHWLSHFQLVWSMVIEYGPSCLWSEYGVTDRPVYGYRVRTVHCPVYGQSMDRPVYGYRVRTVRSMVEIENVGGRISFQFRAAMIIFGLLQPGSVSEP